MRSNSDSSPSFPSVFPGLLLCVALAITAAGCGPSDPLQAIRQQQSAGQFEASLEPLRKLLAERSGDAEIDYLYGRALVQTGRPSLAEWSLRKAMDDPQWLVPAGMQLVVASLGTENYSSAIETTERLLEVEPDNVDVLLLQANAYAHSKWDYEQALADVDHIFELDPDKVEAMEPRILALLGLERIDEAGAAIQELGDRIEETELGSEVRGWYCATAALFAEESGETELAEERWADCLERYPTHANVVRNGVQFYDDRGEFGRSLEILRKALAGAPSSRDYRVRLAERLRSAGRAEEAEAVLREATNSKAPQSAAVAWLDLAKHYQEVGDHAASVDATERVLALARQEGWPQPQLLLEYADALVLAGEFDRALAVANEMTLAPHREVIRARVAQERGRPAEALQHFDEVFRLWPDNPWARYYAALAAEAVGDFDRAIAAYRYSIRISAGATDARTRVARLHLAEGRPAEALVLLRHRADRQPLDLEGELLSLHLWGRVGQLVPLKRSLARLRKTNPDQLGRALASVAEGVREGAGPAAAVRMLRESKELDFEDPRNAEALRALVRFSHEAGQTDEAESDLRAALRAHPDAAVFHEIQGLSLELRGAPEGEVREAYARAVELDPGDARALVGLGRLILDRDPDEALRFFDRAIAADPNGADPEREAARALVAAGRPKEAEERLGALLKEHPYDAGAAAALAELQLDRGPATERTLELAHRAVRFGGGADALDLLSRAYQGRNQPERASAAAARARALREGKAPGASRGAAGAENAAEAGLPAEG